MGFGVLGAVESSNRVSALMTVASSFQVTENFRVRVQGGKAAVGDWITRGAIRMNQTASDAGHCHFQG